jgi:hypothetical protein
VVTLALSPPDKFLPRQELASDLDLDHLIETSLPG